MSAMQTQGKAVSLIDIGDGITELCFNLEGDSVNKFNQLTLGELAEALAELGRDDTVAGLLVTSAKPGYFIVGADITEFKTLFELPDKEFLASFARTQAIFNAVEDLPFPTVTAINGVAMGGGLEMCLATDCRVMASDTRVGMPETKLGLLPGFGGTVRLTRLIGIDNALEWICSGRDFGADSALAVGTVDAVVAPDLLPAAAGDLLGECIAGKCDWQARREEKRQPVQLNNIEKMMAFMTGKNVVAAQAGPNYPAPMMAVKSIEKSAGLARDEALAVERQSFLRLARSLEAGALIGLFLNEQLVQKLARSRLGKAHKIGSAAVLGAGIMGGGIAYQSAFCGVPILMKDIAQQGLDVGMGGAASLLCQRVDRGRMSSAEMAQTLGRIRPQLNYDGIGEVGCVVEAVVEKLGVKQKVLAECESLLNSDAVLSSNTSTISISRLADGLKHPDRFCGMHFFNPVHRMPLVEVIRGEKTSDETIATVVAYARKMKKTPIVVNDCPGFLVNRILTPYFGAFNLLLRDGGDPVIIDKVMERFGWPMGPAYLLDVVGLDVAQHAGQVMAEGMPDRFGVDFRSAAEVLFESGRFGQKTGKGFYKYELDKRGKVRKSPDPELKSLLEPVVSAGQTFETQETIARLMVPMCNEAVRCLDEQIVGTPAELDMALILGIGFPPFRGGALRYIDQMGPAEYCQIADGLASLGAVYQVPDSLRRLAREGNRYFG